jgi:fluoride exporter
LIYLYIAAGGVLGALSRYLLGSWVATAAGPGFPWGTLLINVCGSILLGFLLRSFPTWGTSPDARAFLTVGFCGSFTTFSTFTVETVLLAQSGAYALAAAYALGSLALGVAGVVLGMALAAI